MLIKNTQAKKLTSAAISVVIAAGLLHSSVQASGFALIENSASGQGNAFAGAAAYAEDASTVWFNPAGMTKLKNNQIVVAGHIIIPDSSFTNNGSTDGLGNPLGGVNDDGGSTALVGNFYWVTDLADKTKFGLGITTPFGLTTEYNDTWVGRYHAVKTDMKTINFNPSIAREVTDKLSIGAGLNMLLADITLTSAVDFGSLLGAPQQIDGFADLSADNLTFNEFSWGFNLGMLYDFGQGTSLGVAYRSEIEISAKGKARFKVPAAAAPVLGSGAFQDTGLQASVTMPQSLSMSVNHQLNNIKLLADITWTGWSSFKELRIQYDNPVQPDSVTTENWDDTFRYSIGADYDLNEKMTLRTGVAYDETPIPGPQYRTPRIPGNDRTWLSFGMTYEFNPALIVDVGYSHLFIDDAKIDHTLESSQSPLNATLAGTYSGSVDILSAQLRWNYDL
ncbi:Long-chain fatty acid transport protein [hydrothermal vent metagenome]|uniref:Long-chain fatty acid transport protein n=1 Tax=hydrothermal vent metagenome TaxID=652676 RepID=A0A3B0XGQ9_9ZZZZ